MTRTYIPSAVLAAAISLIAGMAMAEVDLTFSVDNAPATVAAAQACR